MNVLKLEIPDAVVALVIALDDDGGRDMDPTKVNEADGNRLRKTKIICTLGPASDSPEKIEELIKAGMDVARLNLSFGTRDYHSQLIDAVRKTSENLDKPVAVLMDLSGPKIRIGRLSSPVTLHRGERVVLTTGEQGGGNRIPISHPEILGYLKNGDIIHLADGSIKLGVVRTGTDEVEAEVLEGGFLTSYKGINFPETLFDISPITEKDLKDLEFGLKKGVDWVALSFVKSAEDVKRLKEVIAEKKDSIPVIAKIERREAVDNIKRILEASDGIMVARGDLGVELPIEDVPVVQKMAIKMANSMGKPVITATQMLKSMVVQAQPTRAEVTDVANAVLDGSDAVMLSEETAAGKYPVEAVKVMDRIIKKAESMYPYLPDQPAKTVTESIASSAARISAELHANAIITFTRTGASAIQLSRYRPPVPILAAAHDDRTLRRLSLIWGCIPLMPVSQHAPFEELIFEVVREGLNRGILDEDGKVVITSGFPFGEPGTTNTLRVLNVGDVLKRKQRLNFI